MALRRLAVKARLDFWSMSLIRGVTTTAVAVLAAASLAGCGHNRGSDSFVSQSSGGGFHLPGFGGKKHGAVATAPQIGVNAYLWRATLDTLSFMPMTSADPWGGTVITDWYSNPEKTDERFKVTVYILDTRLRADGLKVTVNKQVAGPNGQWVDSAAADQTEQDLQNSILSRARQLRLSNINDRG